MRRVLPVLVIAVLLANVVVLTTGAARRHRSLTRALQAAPAPTSGDPVFLTLPGGLAQLIDALTSSITERGGELHLGETVHGVSPTHVASSSGGHDVDGVVVATPAHVTGPLVEPIEPGVARTLRSIPYASVAMTLLAYDDDRFGDASGFLVPKTEGLLITAASWASAKWAHLSRPGRVLLRVSAGRHGDERAHRLDDAALVARVRTDLATTMGLRAEPTDVQVIRWERAFPQYPPGHQDRMGDAIAALATAAPTIALAGAAINGVGIPACIGSGRAAAGRVLAAIG
jgi:oxygen-dependent protoporphyrinogen oxidase